MKSNYLAVPVTVLPNTSKKSLFAPGLLVFDNNSLQLKVWDGKIIDVANISITDIKSINFLSQKMIITNKSNQVFEVYLTISLSLVIKYPQEFRTFLSKNSTRELDMPSYWQLVIKSLSGLFKNYWPRFSSGTISKDFIESIPQLKSQIYDTGQSQAFRYVSNRRLVLTYILLTVSAIVGFVAFVLL